jgi:2-oxoglutarate dehydrogenase E2 component (dihydrolipoamide succinyltransferase)
MSTIINVNTFNRTPERPALRFKLQQQQQPHPYQVIARAFSSEVFEMTVPAMGDSITEGTVVSWEKDVGDFVKEDDVVVILETDKVSVDVRAPHSGKIVEVFASVDDTVDVGSPLLKLELGAGGEVSSSSSTATPTSAEPSAPAPHVQPPTPAVNAPATSPAAPAAPAAPATPAAPSTPSTPVPATTGERIERRVKMTRMRQRIAQRLKDSQNTAAMLTTFQEVDMGNAMAMRSKYKEAFEANHGARLGFMSLFLKASAAALQEIPAVNAVIDGDSILYRDYVDISVAVASPRGLVVPVVRDVQDLSFAGVEQTIASLGAKARNDQIAMEDMAGGTFTVSNGGVFGSLMGTPIINPPQSAILGMHTIRKRPMTMPDGSIESRPIMYLALTYDHRLVDGREAVSFLCSVRDKVEDPLRILLGV